MDATTDTSASSPELRLDGVRPLIRTFLKGLTEERWRLIRQGTPDDTTQVMLADLLRKIVDIVVKAVMAVAVNINVAVPEECVQSSVTNTLTDSFTESLASFEGVQSVSTEELTRLIVEEVTESVTSESTTSDGTSKESVRKRFPPIQRLESMVKHASTMLRAFSEKLENVYRPQRRKPRSQQASTEDHSELEDIELLDKNGHRSEATQRDSSEDSFVMNATQIVKKVIVKEMEEITEPFLHEVPDSDYEVLQTESSKDIEAVAGDIAQTIAEEAISPKKPDTSEPESPESKQPGKLNLKRIRSKIKNFFTKRIAKVLIHRIVVEVKGEHHLDSGAERRESTESLLADIECLLLKEDGDRYHEDYVVKKFKKISPGKAHMFTQDLSDLLYRHITDRTPHAAKKRKKTSCRIVIVPELHANMYADINNKVYSFLVVMNYWVNFLALSHSKRVAHTLMDLNATAALPAEKAALGDGPVSPPVQDVKRKNELSVNAFVARLTKMIFTKAKVDGFMKPEPILQYLFKKTWAEVERLDFVITENSDEIIFKDLCKRWGSAKRVLIALQLEEPEIGNYIVSCFKAYVTQPKRNAGFFPFVRKSFT